MKILIIHTFGLGDLIMATPMLEELKKNFPYAIIDILFLNKACEEVIRNNININNGIKFESSFFKKIIQLIELKKKKYDISIITSGPTPWKAMIYSKILGASIRCGEIKKINIAYKYFINSRESIHRVEANLKLVEKFLKLDSMRVKCKFYLNPKNIQIAEEFYKKVNKDRKSFIIHPGCSKNYLEKRWDIKNYSCLISKLDSRFLLNFIIILGPDEEEIEIELRKELKNKTNIYYLKKLSIGDIAAIIEKGDYFLNNDSGIGHIVSCFNLKASFTIFGPANPQKVRVYDENNHIIYIKNNNKKYYKRKNKNGILKCLDEITPEQVYNTILKYLVKNN